MSLRKVNATLKEIKEDTGELNQNFSKWFDNEQRTRLDRKEAEIEARNQGSRGSGAGIAAAGGLGLAASGGVGDDGAGAEGEGGSDIFSNIAKGYLFTRAAGALVGAPFKVASRSIRGSAKLIAGAATTFIAATRKLATGDAVKTGPDAKTKAMANSFADIEYEADRAKARADQTRLINDYYRGSDSPEGRQAAADQRIRIENEIKTRNTLRKLQNLEAAAVIPQPPSPTVSTKVPNGLPTPTVGTAPTVPSITTSVTTAAAPKFTAPDLNDVVTGLNLSGEFTRGPLVDYLENDTAKRRLNDLETSQGIKYHVTESGKIDVRRTNGNILPVAEREKAISNLMELQKPPRPVKVSNNIESGDPRRPGAPSGSDVRAVVPTSARRAARVSTNIARSGLSVGLADVFLSSVTGPQARALQAQEENRPALNAELGSAILGDIVAGIAGLIGTVQMGGQYILGGFQPVAAPGYSQATFDAVTNTLTETLTERGIGTGTGAYYQKIENQLGMGIFDPELQMKVIENMTAQERANYMAAMERKQFSYNSGGMIRVAETSATAEAFFEDARLQREQGGGVYSDNSTTINNFGGNEPGATGGVAPDDQIMTDDVSIWRRLFTFGQDRD